MRTGKVLIVDDEENLCRILSLVLKDEGFEIEVANDGQSAVGLIDKNAYDCILTDVRMPELDGLALLREAKKRDPDQAVIVMTAYGNVQLAQEVMRAGAFDYVIKPFDNDELVRTIARAVELRRLRSERETLSEQLADQLGPGQLVGASPAMQQIGKSIAQVGDT
ncbi:MAG: sigma-54-dependent Fis family transcriptional regulator, partial [Candidatus Omnitrophica bacterium]|nr:sigma-54-dependent Fis family transcriptional regulator [Candidatus Omnitrophota bacterium]